MKTEQQIRERLDILEKSKAYWESYTKSFNSEIIFLKWVLDDKIPQQSNPIDNVDDVELERLLKIPGAMGFCGSRPIDNVTTPRLDVLLRLCNIQIHTDIVDKIIDLVQLLEEKAGEASLDDISDLQTKWKNAEPKIYK